MIRILLSIMKMFKIQILLIYLIIRIGKLIRLIGMKRMNLLALVLFLQNITENP